MPDNQNLLGLIGYDVGSLNELFRQTFEDPDPKWSKFLQPSFKLAGEALGELPGQRRGLLEQLTSGLQERSITAGRRISGAAASTGFAGGGQITRLGETSRQEIGGEYGRGTYRIGQDIQRREAGILAALSGNVSSFLAMLLGTAKLKEDTTGTSPGFVDVDDPWVATGGTGVAGTTTGEFPEEDDSTAGGLPPTNIFAGVI